MFKTLISTFALALTITACGSAEGDPAEESSEETAETAEALSRSCFIGRSDTCAKGEICVPNGRRSVLGTCRKR